MTTPTPNPTEHDQPGLPRVYSLAELTGRRAQDERLIRATATISLRKNEALFILVAAVAATAGYLAGMPLGGLTAFLLSAVAGAGAFIYLSIAESASLKGRVRAAITARLSARPGHVYLAGIQIHPGQARTAVLAHAAYMPPSAGPVPSSPWPRACRACRLAPRRALWPVCRACRSVPDWPPPWSRPWP